MNKSAAIDATSELLLQHTQTVSNFKKAENVFGWKKRKLIITLS